MFGVSFCLLWYYVMICRFGYEMLLCCSVRYVRFDMFVCWLGAVVVVVCHVLCL